MKNFSILLKKILPIVSYQFFNKEVIVNKITETKLIILIEGLFSSSIF